MGMPSGLMKLSMRWCRLTDGEDEELGGGGGGGGRETGVSRLVPIPEAYPELSAGAKRCELCSRNARRVYSCSSNTATASTEKLLWNCEKWTSARLL